METMLSTMCNSSLKLIQCELLLEESDGNRNSDNDNNNNSNSRDEERKEVIQQIVKQAFNNNHKHPKRISYEEFQHWITLQPEVNN